jgi:hypothetical protein
MNKKSPTIDKLQNVAVKTIQFVALDVAVWSPTTTVVNITVSGYKKVNANRTPRFQIICIIVLFQANDLETDLQGQPTSWLTVLMMTHK